MGYHIGDTGTLKRRPMSQLGHFSDLGPRPTLGPFIPQQQTCGDCIGCRFCANNGSQASPISEIVEIIRSFVGTGE
jgi:hypothetical protein